MVAVPTIGILTARKSISQYSDKFYLNESFASWLIVLLIGSFTSSQQWYKVVGINVLCFLVQFIIICNFYGLSGIQNDYFIHITTCLTLSSVLIRINEAN